MRQAKRSLTSTANPMHCENLVMVIIRIKNLCHRFENGHWGLKNINLDVAVGEFVVLAGANGSGKTTLLRHLNGLLLPTDGSVAVDGKEVQNNILQVRQMVGMVFQNADSQIVGETVYDDVAFGPENLGWPRKEIVKKVTTSLQQVDLAHLQHQRPHLLSGGEKRRLAIAGILVMNPKIIALDEPFSNLDYNGVKQVLQSIIGLHEMGHTIILATHDLEKVVAHANRLIFIDKGQIARDGAPEMIIKESEAYGVREPCASRLGERLSSWLN